MHLKVLRFLQRSLVNSLTAHSSSAHTTVTVEMTTTDLVDVMGLPRELIIEVLQYLIQRDIYHVALTCKAMAEICRDDYLWRQLFIRRFGTSSLPSHESDITCREEYAKRSSLLIPATELSIIWLDDMHWILEDAPELPGGKAAVLRQVCWLQVTGRLRGVPHGYYRVRWCLAFDSNLSNLEHAMFIAVARTGEGDAFQHELVGDPGIRCTLGKQRLDEFRGVGWVSYEIPDILSVGMDPGDEEFLDVWVEITDHSNLWKTGMRLGCVELVRV